MSRKWQDISDVAHWQLRDELTGISNRRFAIADSASGNCQSIYNRFMLVPILAGTAAAVAAGYQSMAPTGQWFGHTFSGLSRGTKQIALTYDDGPNHPHTMPLLEVLAKHGVHATFFLIGRYVRQRPDIAREVVQAGHV